MDQPQAKDSRFYGWLYRFTHLLAANLDRVLGPASSPVAPANSLPEQHEISLQNKEKE
jgi:hypothetical protein